MSKGTPAMTAPNIEWPREIWMAEREDHDQGVVSAVLSEAATVARFEGDTERDREFHHYIDGDIHESLQRYCDSERHRLTTRVAELEAGNKRLREALAPFAGFVDKDGEAITLKWGASTYSNCLAPKDFYRARAALKEGGE